MSITSKQAAMLEHIAPNGITLATVNSWDEQEIATAKSLVNRDMLKPVNSFQVMLTSKGHAALAEYRQLVQELSE
jgi:predicted transcriptional regulator